MLLRVLASTGTDAIEERLQGVNQDSHEQIIASGQAANLTTSSARLRAATLLCELATDVLLG